MTYPQTPGWKKTDTSEQAALAMLPKSKRLQRLVLEELEKGEGTADDIARRIGEDFMSIRPRLSELFKDGKVIDTKRRGKSRSGKSAIIYGLPRGQMCLL